MSQDTGRGTVTPEEAARVAALGPFFAFEVHPKGSAAPEPWRVLSDLFEPGSGAFAERVAAVRAFLAAGGGRAPEEIEERVAASVTHLGLVSRLLSPVLGCAAALGRIPSLDPERVRWQAELGGTFPLSLPEDAFGSGGDVPLSAVVDGVLRPLEAVALPMSVSPHILRGNAASALNGAARAATHSSSPHADRVRAVASELLGDPYLADAFSDEDGTFRRRSCCLIYRAAPGGAGGLCGDCVLAGDAGA
ncbi:(2Fe-2S)-binding protein [Streptantibioticus parmotrematis]|uniref:(2Fe-2S)-binding protein n=1 Tax=Streptantibioticus parmotrematis TaxID=2873249 RepID=UPI0033F638D4